MDRIFTAVICMLAVVALVGCRSAYYGMWEKLGYEKRDILVSRVEDAKGEQEAAKEQFKTTLERFKDVTNFQGGELESKYRKLNSEYEACVSRADAVSGRIKSVETVANDLFAEWQKEITEYQNADLRRKSEENLAQTKSRYGQLLEAMKRAESKMKPVLAAFKDQVLFLKHNLNAQAVASLQTTAVQIDGDVAELIKDMEASIAEANSFISQLK